MMMRPWEKRTDFRYKEVETALAETFQIREDRMKAFRARIQHLRRLGIPDLPKVGSGTQIRYTDDQVRQLYLALEFAQIGIDPARTVSVIKQCWHYHFLNSEFARLSDLGNYEEDSFLVVRPCFLEEVSVMRLYIQPEPASQANIEQNQENAPDEDETEQFLRGGKHGGVVSISVVPQKELNISHFNDLRAGVSLCVFNISKGLSTLNASLRKWSGP